MYNAKITQAENIFAKLPVELNESVQFFVNLYDNVGVILKFVLKISIRSSNTQMVHLVSFSRRS